MCGINGVFWYRGGEADPWLARAEARAQRHRGPGDADVLARALMRLAEDAPRRDGLSARARATAERFAWDRVQPRLGQLLERWRRT